MLFGSSSNAREILQAEALVGELQKLKSIFPPPSPFLFHIGAFFLPPYLSFWPRPEPLLLACPSKNLPELMLRTTQYRG